MIPAFIINLRSDEDRFERISRSLRAISWIKAKRVDGVYGSSLADDVCLRLTGDPHSIVAKGAVGCFLSHVRAWELIAQANAPWSLILEDDAVLQAWDPTIVEQFPLEADLVFANDRSQSTDPTDASASYQLRPMGEALHRIHRRNLALGTDCYFLSCLGARKLLRAVSQDGYFSHVDMRLLAYSVDLSEIHSAIPGSQIAELVAHAQAVSFDPRPVLALVVSPPLCVHYEHSETTRTREDRKGLSGAAPD